LKKRSKAVRYEQHDLKQGSVLIRQGTVTPESLELESEELCEGWDRVRNTEAGQLELSLRLAGWHMFYMADAVHAFALGALDQDTIRTAATSLLRKLRPQMFNCVELTGLSAKHFAGIPYVHLSGTPRHIQESGEIDRFVSRRNEITRTALESRTESDRDRMSAGREVGHAAGNR
jgi:hypothetical protein